jgi:hypothetical protein
MNENEFYPWIREAWSLTRHSKQLKSDWHCCINIARQQCKTDRLSNVQLNHVCYRWLASIGYQNLKVIN